MRPIVRFVRCLALLTLATACTVDQTEEGSTDAPSPAVVAFRDSLSTWLQQYETEYQRLFHEASLADWESNTRIVEGDSTNAVRTKRAKEAYAKYVGSVENIERIRGYLARTSDLTPLHVRQLEMMLYFAADQPQTIADVVARRIARETEQVEKLYGYTFRLRGRPVTPNQIDSILRASITLADREAAWVASKEIGAVLKPGLVQIRDLRNESVKALGYPDFFTYQVSDYGMTVDEMLALLDNLNGQLRPLYRELHTWARHELAARYKQPVPDLIPAHWLPNRWGQNWSDLVNVAGLNADSTIGQHDAEWVVKQGEAFYVSLGFDSLPRTFWETSSLYELPPDAPFKKNTHASAWHLDLDRDVRSLMSVEPNSDWYETTHHELGHVYYFMAYSNPQVPLVLRQGANRAYHEGIGSMIGMAALQRRFLANRGLVPADAQPDQIQQLLKEALNFVVFIPFSAGTMTHFERQLYAGNLSPNEFNRTWWDLARRYQGIAPPRARPESYADAATKTHINDDPAQYYDYALANALLFQLHQHIAQNILKQDPHDTDYFGSRETGDFLRTLMAPGASRPWRTVLRETTGRELDAQAMVEYFAPLQRWLEEQNKGRTHTLPEL